jgi:hypothetical protein
MVVFQYAKDWVTPPSWIILVVVITVFFNIPLMWFKKQISYSLIWQAAKKNPDSFITSILIDTIWELEKFPQKWPYLYFRKELASNINLCCVMIEKYLCRHIPGRERPIESWFKRATRDISAKLREKEMWLLTPSVETSECLKIELTFFLKHFVLGNWDLLPKDQTRTYDHHWLSDRPMLKAMLSFVIALFPIGILFGFQLSSLALENPIRDYASAVAILWAVYVMFDVLDFSLTSQFASWLQSLGVMSRLIK